MSVTTRALTRTIAVGAGAALLLTGCGGSEEPTASPSEARHRPATINHARGAYRRSRPLGLDSVCRLLQNGRSS